LVECPFRKIQHCHLVPPLNPYARRTESSLPTSQKSRVQLGRPFWLLPTGSCYSDNSVNLSALKIL
jgi:hypothetical protein